MLWNLEVYDVIRSGWTPLDPYLISITAEEVFVSSFDTLVAAIPRLEKEYYINTRILGVRFLLICREKL